MFGHILDTHVDRRCSSRAMREAYFYIGTVQRREMNSNDSLLRNTNKKNAKVAIGYKRDSTSILNIKLLTVK